MPGADTVLLVDAAGNVVEGPGFNVFCVKDGVLVTPDEGMLEGISRRTVIEMAAALGLPVQTRPVPADELRGADEVFLSTSGGGVLPVTQVDQQTIGDGTPGAGHAQAGRDLLGLARRSGLQPADRLFGLIAHPLGGRRAGGFTDLSGAGRVDAQEQRVESVRRFEAPVAKHQPRGAGHAALARPDAARRPDSR